MSLIVYSKGVLAADTRAIQNFQSSPDHIGVSLATKKIHVYDNKYAIAVCGANMDEKDWAQVGAVLYTKILILELDLTKTDAPMTIDDILAINSWQRQFIVMTRDYVYLLSNDGNLNIDRELSLVRHDRDVNIMFGSGSHVANVALTYGKSAAGAVEFTSSIVRTVGGPVVSVWHGDLKPLINPPPATAPAKKAAAKKTKKVTA